LALHTSSATTWGILLHAVGPHRYGLPGSAFDPGGRHARRSGRRTDPCRLDLPRLARKRGACGEMYRAFSRLDRDVVAVRATVSFFASNLLRFPALPGPLLLIGVARASASFGGADFLDSAGHRAQRAVGRTGCGLDPGARKVDS